MCDFRRFEEQYPFVASADPRILDHLGRSSGSPPRQEASDPANPRADACGVDVGRLPGSSSTQASWGPYRRSSPLDHVYEVIRDGSPCRMYFDLEFQRACNEGLDGEALVQAWINVVAGEVYWKAGGGGARGGRGGRGSGASREGTHHG